MGTTVNSFTVSEFGQPDQTPKDILQGNILVDVSHLGIIKVSGKDAEKFLQGQFTNDVREVTATQSQLSAWCSAKGRMLVNFRVFKREGKQGSGGGGEGNTFYLLMPQLNVETTLKRLQIYVLRSQVKLEEVTKGLPRLGIAGEQSTELLAACLGLSHPLEVNGSVTVEGLTVLRVQGSPGRYLVLSEDVQRLQGVWECLANRARPVGTWAWEVLDILAGVPHILPVLADVVVPQMVNYPTLGGVSFKKGCYPGQEVVARMQYLGTPKRQMYLVELHSATTPQPGEQLYVSDEEPSIGQIVNAQKCPGETPSVIALAVISISHVEKGVEIYVERRPGDCLKIL
jgi:tRNA-modifying protein YgfZ